MHSLLLRGAFIHTLLLRGAAMHTVVLRGAAIHAVVLLAGLQTQCGVHFFIWIRDVFWPQHPRCWDPISKHISNPNFACKPF
jgi:hypothetical protein